MIQSTARYTIGIDLGTTNSVLAYLDTEAASETGRSSVIMPVLQLDGPGTVSESLLLPSFVYLLTEQERRNTGFVLPFGGSGRAERVNGRFARSQTAVAPGRVVASAKSWLCHGGVDREDQILPWKSIEVTPDQKLSPVSAAAAYLRQLREVWEYTLGRTEARSAFADQCITITVPASFDEAAQRYTLQAAQEAGYPESVMLLEEPQAAFYYWLEQHGSVSALLAHLPALQNGPQVVLVVDVGGGTTDFSLFKIDPLSSGAAVPRIQRLVVGEHILLGGDNMDLALAHVLAAKLGAAPKEFSRGQWGNLLYQARDLKERTLGLDQVSEECRFSVLAESAGLFASVRSGSIRRSEVEEVLLEGFFPFCEALAQPQRSSSGLQEWGLPFAVDSGITRHLAAFLRGHEVDAVLFNGGALKPVFLQERLLKLIESWQGGRKVAVLRNPDLDLAVAHGAANFGWVVRKGSGRIQADYPRSVYIEVVGRERDAEAQLLCVLSKGAQLGQRVALAGCNLKLLVDQAARFQAYTALLRPGDQVGAVVAYNEREFHRLPALQTFIPFRGGFKKRAGVEVDVALEAGVSETGRLELGCTILNENESKRFALEFDLQRQSGPTQAQVEAGSVLTVSEARVQKAKEQILALYGRASAVMPQVPPKSLMRELEGILGHVKADWDTNLCRSLWEPLSQGVTRRQRSLEHELSWLALAGYILRPRYGAELDPLRISELWRVHELGLAFRSERSAFTQWCILWRRVAGGLNREQQRALFDEVLPMVQRKGVENAEAVRLMASLERISETSKFRLAEVLIARISDRSSKSAEHYYWSLGRVGSRQPLYANLYTVVPAAGVSSWFERLERLDWGDPDYRRLNEVFAQAARRTGDAERDLPEEWLLRILDKLQKSKASGRQLALLRDVCTFEFEERSKLFGETLPVGLRLG